jgi:hypothetical protein
MNMDDDGWWMVVTTVCPLLARFFSVTIKPRDVAASRPVVVAAVLDL